VFTGPGIVSNGQIAELKGTRTIEELKENLIICPPSEMIDKLRRYAELGIDDFIMNVNIGAPQKECLEVIERFATEVMPHFSTRSLPVLPAAQKASSD
jgi:hypothetical protein